MDEFEVFDVKPFVSRLLGVQLFYSFDSWFLWLKFLLYVLSTYLLIIFLI